MTLVWLIIIMVYIVILKYYSLMEASKIDYLNITMAMVLLSLYIYMISL